MKILIPLVAVLTFDLGAMAQDSEVPRPIARTAAAEATVAESSSDLTVNVVKTARISVENMVTYIRALLTPAESKAVKLATDARTNSLIIGGDAAERHRVTAIIDVIDSAVRHAHPHPDVKRKVKAPAPAPDETERIDLRHTDAREATSVVHQLMHDAMGRNLTVVPLVSTNSILVRGNPEAVAMIKKVIALLDVPSQRQQTDPRAKTPATPAATEPKTIYETVKVIHEDVRQVESALAKAMPVMMSNEPYRIVTLKRTNTLLLLGSPAALEKMKELIAVIDLDSSGK